MLTKISYHDLSEALTWKKFPGKAESAIYLLGLEKFLDNNFLIIKEDKGLFSPVSVLFYQEFESDKEVKQYLEENKDNLQCIVGKEQGFTPFGYSQQPVITEYADGVNTLDFLVNL